jgi:hypothetical protein
MNRRHLILGYTFLVILLMTALLWFLWDREQQRQWPMVQQRRAIALSLALADYQKAHGAYPPSLTALVDSAVLTRKHFEDLQFQASRHSSPCSWRYHVPSSFPGIVITAPASVMPWPGSNGLWITAYSDGGGGTLSSDKLLYLKHEVK